MGETQVDGSKCRDEDQSHGVGLVCLFAMLTLYLHLSRKERLRADGIKLLTQTRVVAKRMAQAGQKLTFNFSPTQVGSDVFYIRLMGM